MKISIFVIIVIFIQAFAFNFPTSFDDDDDEILYEKWQLTRPNVESNNIESAIRKYFEKRTKILNIRVLLDVAENNTWQSYFTDNIIDMLQNSTKLSYKINIQTTERRSLYYNNIFYVDSYESLANSLPIFRGDRGNFAGNYIILLKTSKEEFEYEEEIKLIFEKLFEVDIINVNVVVMNSTAGSHSLYSYEVFQAENCRETIPKIVNYYKNGRFRNDELFPPKLKNFNQCRLKFLSRNVPPFFNYNREERIANTLETYGFESTMIELMALHFNFTPVMKLLPKDVWGDVYENGTVTGPFAELKFREVDLLMGFFAYEPRRMRMFGQTKPYILSPVIVVVNRKREIVTISSTWFLDPYEYTAWLLLIGTLLAAFALLGLAYQAKLFRSAPPYPTWLQVLGSALCSPCTISDGGGRPYLRVGIMTWSIAFIICNAAYAGKLFVAYNRSDTNRVMTLDELKRDNYTFLVRKTFNSTQLLEEVLGVTTDRIVRVATNDANEIYDLMANHSGKVATLATDLRVIYYMLQHDYYDLLYTLPEIMRMRQICVYFRSHSYMIQLFDDLIGKLMDFGLLRKWYRDTEYDLNKEYFRLMDSQLSKDAKALTLSTFRRIFFGYMALMSVAILSFFVELGVHAIESKLKQKAKCVYSKKTRNKSFI